MSIEVTPIDATLGAVVTGVDLATLDDATWEEIHDAFLIYGLLVFPGQHNLDDESQGAFALRFGKTGEACTRSRRALSLDSPIRKPTVRWRSLDSSNTRC